jgi:cob(I)alamin adenosyltransferase
MNRLSDLFFVLARWVGKHMVEEEHLWQGGLKNSGKKIARRKAQD